MINRIDCTNILINKTYKGQHKKGGYFIRL